MYAVINSDAVLEQALALCPKNASYQRNILRGVESLSGSTLRGAARNWGYFYKQSSARIIAKCQRAGLAVREEIAAHGKRVVVVG